MTEPKALQHYLSLAVSSIAFPVNGVHHCCGNFEGTGHADDCWRVQYLQYLHNRSDVTGTDTLIDLPVNVKKVADVIVVAGIPLLTIVRHINGLSLLYWADVSRYLVHTYLLIPVEQEMLRQYLLAKLTLLDLFNAAEKMLSIDVMSDTKCVYQTVQFNELPSSYVPATDSYLSETLCADASRIIYLL